MSEQIEYTCLFEHKICGVRTQWKLLPENMVEWCKTCRGQGTSELMRTTDRLISMIDDMRQKSENVQMAFMDALKMFMVQAIQMQAQTQTREKSS